MNELNSINSYLTNFFFIVFSANPSKDIVKVYVDEGKIRFIMKREKFLNLIKNHLGDTMRNACEPCLSEYGTFYIISRVDYTLRKLSFKNEMEKINPSKIYRDYYIQEKKPSDFYVNPKEYEKSIQSYIDDGIKNRRKITTGFINLSEKDNEK